MFADVAGLYKIFYVLLKTLDITISFLPFYNSLEKNQFINVQEIKCNVTYV